MDIQERLTAFAMLGATWVMWLLVGLSVVCLAIILDRAYYLLSTRDDLPSLREALRKLYRDGDVESAKKRAAESRSAEAGIIAAVIEDADRGPDVLGERLEGESAIVKTRMERNLAFLGTVGNNAPFVGLLGTVIGIIRAFHELDQSGGEVTSGLMAEVGEALVATAIGILVAIPSVAAYNFFGRVVRYRMVWAQTMGSDLLAHVKAGLTGEKAEPAAQKES
jgi:biopolymer transport protein ExbB